MKKFNRKLFKRNDDMVEQGWRSGKNTRQCGPGSNPGVDAICRLSLLLVLSLAPRDFSNVSFSLFSKTNTCKFQFDQVDQEPASGSATSKSLFIIYSLFKWK